MATDGQAPPRAFNPSKAASDLLKGARADETGNVGEIASVKTARRTR